MLAFTQFGKNLIFIKGPFDEVLKGDIVHFVSQYFIESVPGKDKTGDLVFGFDGVLSHGVVEQRLLSERIFSSEFSNALIAFPDTDAPLFDVV